MAKTSSTVVLFAAAILSAIVLAGCSAGQLPGGSNGTSNPSGASGKTAPSAAPPSDDLTAVPKNCPKAAEVSALVGFTVPDPDPRPQAGGLACTYAGSNPANDMQINFHAASSGTTAASVKAELLNGHSGVSVTPISGLGQAAYAYSGPSGGAAILVWNKGVEFSVVDGRDVDGVHRVAVGVLAGD